MQTHAVDVAIIGRAMAATQGLGRCRGEDPAECPGM